MGARIFDIILDAAFLLTVVSFLLAVGLFLLTIDSFSFFTYSRSFSAYSLVSLLTVGAFCLQWESASNKGLRGCKQRSLTVSKKTPTVSKKFPPIVFVC